jgi:hypothetical protein
MKVPGHAEWPARPLGDRCDWWVDRLGTFATVVAGRPRISGAAADRLPLQDSLGATVQAMVIGAIRASTASRTARAAVFRPGCSGGARHRRRRRVLRRAQGDPQGGVPGGRIVVIRNY